MTDFRQAEVPAGMKAYGPAHPDYPNAPKDWNFGPVLGDDGEMYEADEDGGLDWHHGLSARDIGADIIAYTHTPSTPVQSAGEAFHETGVSLKVDTPPAPASIADEARAREVLIDLICAESPGLFRNGVRDAVEKDMEAIRCSPSRVVRAMLAFAARPAGEGVREAAQFLSDRLDDLEWMDDDIAATCRDYMGHVDPAHHRLKAALTEGIPS